MIYDNVYVTSGSKMIYNNISENVTIRFNGVNYCVFIYLTDIGNKPVTLHVTTLFKPNTTLAQLCCTFNIKIVNFENNKTYVAFPQGREFLPFIGPMNYTLYPYQTIWFRDVLLYICPPCNSSDRLWYSNLTTLLPEKYELIVCSFLNGYKHNPLVIKVPFDAKYPIGNYLVKCDGILYAILPQNATEIKIGNTTGYLKEVTTYVYEITNSQQVCKNLNCISPAFPLKVSVLLNGKQYSAELLGVNYFPSIE
ncbi:hypothetical protein [Acidianus sp. HS-5]|uniref:hypothetical protein n=1 Tax=Acidianus sp. HS-5 TaxID=2886040 RepID=UPI001F3EEBED|nr:hypothetical protein [Acidianus sp. HS-5]